MVDILISLFMILLTIYRTFSDSSGLKTMSLPEYLCSEIEIFTEIVFEEVIITQPKAKQQLNPHFILSIVTETRARRTSVFLFFTTADTWSKICFDNVSFHMLYAICYSLLVTVHMSQIPSLVTWHI